jgi:hypothetical protein
MRLAALALGLLLAGCASTYSLTLMPRTSGQMYYGEATSRPGQDAQVTITLGERVYRGTWVVNTPPPTTGFVVGGIFGSRRSGIGTSVVIDNPAGTDAKALLRADDGSGLRCDLKGVHSGSGSGTCQDDKGLVYDVQIRLKEGS